MVYRASAVRVANVARSARRLDRLESVLNRTTPLSWEPSEENPAIDATELPALIGFDTSALKAYRRTPIEWNRLLDRLDEKGVSVVIPGQAIQEYWNNHRTFTKEDATRLKGLVDKLSAELGTAGVALGASLTGDLQNIVTSFEQETKELQNDPAFLQRSIDVLDRALRDRQAAFVPRTRFYELANVRLGSKMAPGFDDTKSKAAALGDFFVWADFLLGAMAVVDAGRPRPPAGVGFGVFVTDDKKTDWRTGYLPHPALSAEFARASGLRLGIATFGEVRTSPFYRELVGK